MNDYSQNGEQKIITDFFGDKVGSFLDIGAFDGVTGSNSRALFDMGWHGLCVEPDPANFLKLWELYKGVNRVQCLHAAVAGTSHLSMFYANATQCSTCTALWARNTGHVRPYYVACVTPALIGETFGDDWTFVSVDCEGLEGIVVDALTPLLAKTQLLCVETVSPPDKPSHAELVALQQGFKVLGWTLCKNGEHANTFFVR